VIPSSSFSCYLSLFPSPPLVFTAYPTLNCIRLHPIPFSLSTFISFSLLGIHSLFNSYFHPSSLHPVPVSLSTFYPSPPLAFFIPPLFILFLFHFLPLLLLWYLQLIQDFLLGFYVIPSSFPFSFTFHCFLFLISIPWFPSLFFLFIIFFLFFLCPIYFLLLVRYLQHVQLLSFHSSSSSFSFYLSLFPSPCLVFIACPVLLFRLLCDSLLIPTSHTMYQQHT
jgi:hypothetical protein